MESSMLGKIVQCVNAKPLEGNTIAPPLIEGESYPVVGVVVCECGQNHFNVGLISKVNYVTCYKCRKALPEGNAIHWAHPSRFVLNEV